MSAVWVARDGNGNITCVSHDQDVAACYGVADEFATVTLETLLTPEQAAVIAAAKAWAEAQVTLSTGKERESAGLALITAIRTLRAQEGE